MIKLKHLLKEWGEVDPGPKRWFKPYGDKYTEFEKSTNHTNKEPIKEIGPGPFGITMAVGLLLKGLYQWVKSNPKYKQKLKDFVEKL